MMTGKVCRVKPPWLRAPSLGLGAIDGSHHFSRPRLEPGESRVRRCKSGYESTPVPGMGVEVPMANSLPLSVRALAQGSDRDCENRGTTKTKRRYALAIQVLVVCTANICRSPLAEAFLRARLIREGVHVEVRSAGLLAGGQPASPAAVSVALEYGIDLSGHVSQILGSELLAETELVLGMSAEHVREVVALSPALWPKAFTLKELVNRGGRIGPRVRDHPLHEWLRRASTDREITDLLRAPNQEDVADPIGASLAELRVLARELDTLLGRVVNLAWTAHHNGREQEGPQPPVSTPPDSGQLGPRR